MNDRIVSARPKSGAGVRQPFEIGVPAHNPEPSTVRGKRRHNARNEEAKNRAEKAWKVERSTKPSRYQKAMATSY